MVIENRVIASFFETISRVTCDVCCLTKDTPVLRVSNVKKGKDAKLTL